MADTGTRHMSDSIDLSKSKTEVSFKYTVGDTEATKGQEEQLSLQEAFKRYRKARQEEVRSARQLRKRWKAKQKDPMRMAQLREKFIKQAMKYYGYPYAKKYWPPGSPEYKSRLFLDCCGLVRQVMRDLQDDFGFIIGGGNQAYMYDTLPKTVERARDMKPGDLVFMSGLYTNSKTKKQRHNMTHVEIWLGDGNKTIGSRWNNGKVQVWDNYKFSAKSFHSEVYYFKSIDSWLKGKCVSHCPKHSWRPPVYNITKKSIFNPQQDIEQDEAAGDEDDDNAQFQDLYVQGYNLPIVDANQSSDGATESSTSLAAVKDDIKTMKADVELTLSQLEPSDTVTVCLGIDDNEEMEDSDDQDDVEDGQNELNDTASESSEPEDDVISHSSVGDKFSIMCLNGANDHEASTIKDMPQKYMFDHGKGIERQESFLGADKRASAVKEIDKIKSDEATQIMNICESATLSFQYSHVQQMPNKSFCTVKHESNVENIMKIHKPPIESSIFNDSSKHKSNEISQKADQDEKPIGSFEYEMEESLEAINTNQNAKPNLLREVVEKNRNKNARPKTMPKALQRSRGNTPEDMCKTYHDHSLACPDEYNESGSSQNSRSSSSLSEEQSIGCNMRKPRSAGSDEGRSESLEAMRQHQGGC